MQSFQKRHPPVGARPGTLVIPEHAARPAIRVVEYDNDGVEERAVADPAGLGASSGRPRWVSVEGLGDERILRALADEFGIHPLALEDVVNVPARPGVRAYDEHVLMVTRVLLWSWGQPPRFQQLSIFTGADYVLTFEEVASQALAPVRWRVEHGRDRPIRNAGPEYLAYVILDTVVDGYFPLLEAIGEHLEQTERRIFREPRPRTLDQLGDIKSVLLTLRRIVIPQRDAVRDLVHTRDDDALVPDSVRVFMHDTLDHCRQLVEAVDSDRELANDLMHTYLSIVSHRTNEVMRVLTVVTSVFIPLTFVAGIYGMNFERMPELHLPWAYPALLGGMALVAGALLIFFGRMGWLASRGTDDVEQSPIG